MSVLNLPPDRIRESGGVTGAARGQRNPPDWLGNPVWAKICVILADAFPHLTDPGATLRKWGARLAPGGVLVVSVPNVVHHRVLRGLVRGRWNYADSGIADWTHLRFFTRMTALQLFEQAGFHVERMERAIRMPRSTALARVLEAGISGERKLEIDSGQLDQTRRTTLTDVCTSQYLIVARLDGSAAPARIGERTTAVPAPPGT